MWSDDEIAEQEADWVRCNNCDEVVHVSEAKGGDIPFCAPCFEEREARPKMTLREFLDAANGRKVTVHS